MNYVTNEQIKVVLDSPHVGRNLVDHPMMYFFYAITNSSAINHVDKFFSNRQLNNVFTRINTSLAAFVMLKHVVKYALSGTGFLSTPAMITQALITTGRLPEDYQSDVQVVRITCVVRLHSLGLPHAQRPSRQWH